MEEDKMENDYKRNIFGSKEILKETNTIILK